ncbi:hypothetical protein LguiB_000878 [Lonicera macranthoides]
MSIGQVPPLIESVSTSQIPQPLGEFSGERNEEPNTDIFCWMIVGVALEWNILHCVKMCSIYLCLILKSWIMLSIWDASRLIMFSVYLLMNDWERIVLYCIAFSLSFTI